MCRRGKAATAEPTCSRDGVKAPYLLPSRKAGVDREHALMGPNTFFLCFVSIGIGAAFSPTTA